MLLRVLRGQCSGNSKQVEAVGSVPYIASPLNRQLELTTASGVVITTFTQAEIDAGCVVFVQEGQVWIWFRLCDRRWSRLAFNTTAFYADKYGGTGHKCVGNGSN